MKNAVNVYGHPKDDKFDEKNITGYCIYSRGSFRIFFDAKNYQLSGAIARAINLAKSFFDVKLSAIDGAGHIRPMWPIEIELVNKKNSKKNAPVNFFKPCNREEVYY